MNLQRWLSARTIKETMVSPIDWRYPFVVINTYYLMRDLE